MLAYDLVGKKCEFFNFCHTGASHIAQRGNAYAPARRREDDGRFERRDSEQHYFNIELDLMQEMVIEGNA